MPRDTAFFFAIGEKSGLGFLLLALIQVGVTALRSWVVMVLGTTLNLQLFSNLFRHLLRLPMSFSRSGTSAV